MGSDLHMTPPTPPERVIAVTACRMSFYIRQTDPLFGATETERFQSEASIERGASTLRLAWFIAGIDPGIRVENMPESFIHPDYVPEAMLNSDAEKRARLALVLAEADKLRAELGIG